MVEGESDGDVSLAIEAKDRKKHNHLLRQSRKATSVHAA